MDTHHPHDPIPGAPLGSPGPRMQYSPDDRDEIIADAEGTTPPQCRRRGRLLAGVALGAVVLAAGGVFLVSQFNTIYPVTVASALANARQAMDSARRVAHDFVAPAAVIAAAPEPLPTPPSVYVPPPRSSRDTQVGELMGLRAPSVPVAPAAKPAASEAAAAPERRPPVETPPLAARLAPAPLLTPAIVLPEPAAAPARPPVAESTTVPAAAAAAVLPPFVILPPVTATPQAPTPATTATAAPAQPAPAVAVAALAPRAETSASAPSAAPLAGPELAPAAPLVVLPVAPSAPRAAAPRDVLAIASNLRAVPATPAEQVELLAIVSEMATMVKDTRNANHQMRDALAAMRERQDFELVDFARRLALAEARSAMNAARTAGVEPPPPAPSAALAFTPVSTNAAPGRPPAAPVSGVGRSDETRRRYRVQAASPGMAMLSEVDRTGDGGTPLQIAVGDEVPGYGRVTAIAQTGNSWVVRAERGNIQ